MLLTLLARIMVMTFSTTTVLFAALPCSEQCKTPQGACTPVGGPCNTVCHGIVRHLDSCLQYYSADYDPTGYCCQECPY